MDTYYGTLILTIISGFIISIISLNISIYLRKRQCYKMICIFKDELETNKNLLKTYLMSIEKSKILSDHTDFLNSFPNLIKLPNIYINIVVTENQLYSLKK